MNIEHRTQNAQHRSSQFSPLDVGRSKCPLIRIFIVSLGLWVIGYLGTCEASALIAEGSLAPLQAELIELKTSKQSSTSKRRVCKGVIRNAQALIEAQPEASNRFPVLALILKAQQRLLVMDNSQRNRDAFFKTCEALAQAPDAYSSYRLNAELILSERDLSARDADAAERTQALAAMVQRYRNTPGEVDSLMAAISIATQLGAYDLKEQLVRDLSERFAGIPTAIAFRRKHSGLSKLEVMFAGTYTRVDGVPLKFPVDRMGHLCIMVFWSRETPGFELYLKQIKELQTEYPDRFDVFSFNLDELPDGGMATLRKLELNWTVMRLPGGKKHPAFRSYAKKDPAGIFVNAYGRALLSPTAEQEEKFMLLNERISDERYLAQLQSLFIGEFLVREEPSSTPNTQVPKDPNTQVPKDPNTQGALKAIHGCLVAAPFRYRLKPEQALANYQKAEKLCAAAIRKAPKSPELRDVRNHRIIALLGMWNLACEPKHLAEAVKEAKAVLAMKLPRGADVVPRFCLAKAALRRGESGESVLPAFVEATCGTNAPASALAAAAMLAVDANARDLHERYRSKLLAVPDGDNPSLWPVVAFMRDRVHTYDLLRANYIWRARVHERQRIRNYIINLGGEPTTDRLPEITLKTLDGSRLSVPRDRGGKLTLLVFVEPSADPDAEFPMDADAESEKKKGQQHSVLRDACNLADRHVNKEVNTIVAFLSDDAGRIDALIKTRELTCQAVMVPGGLANPMVRRLGILSADRIPNVFLLRRNGTIAWRASGLPYADAEEWVDHLAAKVHIEVCELEHAYKALEKGDFKEAARVFGGPYLPWRPDRFGWRGPRYHGQAVAHMGAKNWATALESIDKAIDAQKLKYFQGKRNKDPANWQKEAATVTVEQPDDILVELWATKAVILDQLGRKEEAAKMSRRSKEPARIEPSSVYKLFHEREKKWRMRNNYE